MPKFGAHAFVWIDEWTTEKGNAAIAAAARQGFDFIEIPLLRPEEFNAPAHRQALEQAGIYATASLVLPKRAHLPAHPELAMQFLMEALDQVSELGSTYLCGCLAYALGVFTGAPPTAAERQAVVEVMGTIAAEADSRGITLGLEAVNRYEGYLYNTLADTRTTLKAIGAPNFQLHADTYHMNIEEEGFYKPLVESADLLGYIHMSESHRGLVGTGTIDWDEVFRGLADAHYQGPLVLESFTSINPDLQASTCMWRTPKHDGTTTAGEGLKFLKDKAKTYLV